MNERSSCGVGFVVSRDGTSNHDIVKEGLKALKRVEHRGAVASDRLTGDGAGLTMSREIFQNWSTSKNLFRKYLPRNLMIQKIEIPSAKSQEVEVLSLA